LQGGGLAMAFPTTEIGWKRRAADFLKEDLVASGLTYDLLAHLLKSSGFDDTVASVTMKLKRGSFSAAWLLAALSVNGAADISFKDIETLRLDGKIPHHRNRRNLLNLRQYLNGEVKTD
jgi:hypothetical protein